MKRLPHFTPSIPTDSVRQLNAMAVLTTHTAHMARGHAGERERVRIVRKESTHFEPIDQLEIFG